MDSGTIAGIIVLAIAAFAIYWFLFRKKKLVVEPPVVQRKTILLLNTPPTAMDVGQRFQVSWDTVNQPSGEHIFDTVNWRVERDPRAPSGGPDIPCLNVDSAAMITAVAPGTRKIYAAFASDPEVQVVSFIITVV